MPQGQSVYSEGYYSRKYSLKYLQTRRTLPVRLHFIYRVISSNNNPFPCTHKIYQCRIGIRINDVPRRLNTPLYSEHYSCTAGQLLNYGIINPTSTGHFADQSWLISKGLYHLNKPSQSIEPKPSDSWFRSNFHQWLREKEQLWSWIRTMNGAHKADSANYKRALNKF